MEGTIPEQLRRRVVEQHGLMREPAPDRAVVSGTNRVEQVGELADEHREVAVHRQDVPTGRRAVAVAQRESHTAGRIALDQPDARLGRGELADDGRGVIGAVVVDEDDLVQIGVVRGDQLRDEWLHVHRLVVAGDDNRYRAVQLGMAREARRRTHVRALAWLLSGYEERAAERADTRNLLKHERRRLEGRYQSRRGPWVDDVVGSDLDLLEPGRPQGGGPFAGA